MPTASPSESLVAIAAMALVALICRWVFTPTHARVRRPAGPKDYGLLVPVATVRTEEDATMLRDLLRAEGVRSSVSPELEVLVFARDLERARALVGSR